MRCLVKISLCPEFNVIRNYSTCWCFHRFQFVWGNVAGFFDHVDGSFEFGVVLGKHLRIIIRAAVAFWFLRGPMWNVVFCTHHIYVGSTCQNCLKASWMVICSEVIRLDSLEESFCRVLLVTYVDIGCTHVTRSIYSSCFLSGKIKDRLCRLVLSCILVFSYVFDSSLLLTLIFVHIIMCSPAHRKECFFVVIC